VHAEKAAVKSCRLRATSRTGGKDPVDGGGTFSNRNVSGVTRVCHVVAAVATAGGGTTKEAQARRAAHTQAAEAVTFHRPEAEVEHVLSEVLDGLLYVITFRDGAVLF